MLGADSVIHPRARIESAEGNVVIGRRCIVSERSIVGAAGSAAAGQARVDRGDEGGVLLGDYVRIEVGAVVEAGGTVIGDGCTLGVGSRVGKGAVLGKVGSPTARRASTNIMFLLYLQLTTLASLPSTVPSLQERPSRQARPFPNTRWSTRTIYIGQTKERYPTKGTRPWSGRLRSCEDSYRVIPPSFSESIALSCGRAPQAPLNLCGLAVIAQQHPSPSQNGTTAHRLVTGAAQDEGSQRCSSPRSPPIDASLIL